ncbi:MAG: glycosyltransferase family 2 protein, partial [Elusimicrobia bacterium]|nr:glycosyltransferase family 2 protein [Elusimicrobiota bacterium]
MNNEEPLLSICIPTYNRAEYLTQILNSIVENEGFGKDVEVVISDNCSTDNTEEVCKIFTEKYSNIKYFKQPNPTYIADQNFIDVLSLAKGKY